MSKNEKQNSVPITDAVAATQTAQSAPDLNDVNFYLANYTTDLPVQPPLPFREGFDPAGFQFRYFRPDELIHLDGGPRCGYWRVVKLAGATANIPHSDFFEPPDSADSPWDKTGRVPYGRLVQTEAGEQSREQYLCVRPIGAYKAEQIIRAQESEKQLAPDNGQLERDRAAYAVIGKPGDVTLQSHQMKMVTSSGWGGMAQAAAGGPA